MKILFLLFITFLFAACEPLDESDNGNGNYVVKGIFRVNEHDNITSTGDVLTEWLLPVFVNMVIDGDTIVVNIDNPPRGIDSVERVRFLGIDAPERDEPFADEATIFVSDLIRHQRVYLAFDWDLRDRFDRLLAYVFISDGVAVNALVLQQGYAVLLSSFPFKFLDEFEDHEDYARTRNLGIWSL